MVSDQLVKMPLSLGLHDSAMAVVRMGMSNINMAGCATTDYISIDTTRKSRPQRYMS